MPPLPSSFEDLQTLLPPREAAKPDLRPLYYLWVHDPHEDRIHVEENESKHSAEHVDHGDLAKRVPHPDRTHGYAYRIRGGWRITDWEHRQVDDPHIVKKVKEALKGE